MVKCVAQMCGQCGVIHNVSDPCPFEALWLKKYQGKSVSVPVGDDFVLEVTPFLSVDSSATSEKPRGAVADNENEIWNKAHRGPIHEIEHETKEFAKIPEVKLAEELENGLWTGWMEMEAYYEGLKGVIHGDVEA